MLGSYIKQVIMGEVQVDKITVDSHIHSVGMLKAILEQDSVNISFVTDNGTVVNLHLHPDTYNDEIVEVLESDEIRGRLNRLGLDITSHDG